MSKKRILVITNMYPTAEHKSFGIFVKNQVDALIKRNLYIEVVAVTNPNSGKMNVIKKYSAWLMRILWILFTKGRSFDVVHAHYVFPSGLFALLLKKLFRTRMVVTAHGGDIDRMAKKSERVFQLTKKILHESDHVMAVGEELYEKIVTDFSLDPVKISIVNMGVNRQVFKPLDKIEARMQYGLPLDEKVVLFVGNLIEQKGLIELVDAIKLIQSKQAVKLYLIGAEKNPVFKRRLEKHIIEVGLQETIKFLGVKDQQEIARLMSAADCLVLPSHMEGFGLVALEAMACETPVVGTNVGGLKHLLSEDAGKITPVKNAPELATAILEVLTSEELRGKLIKNGIQKAEENDQERMLNRVMDVYFPTGG